jgi:hypothetical protein
VAVYRSVNTRIRNRKTVANGLRDYN